MLKMSKLCFVFILFVPLFLKAQIVINEVDADTPGVDALEFVELFGPANTSLNGLVLVFYNGATDTSYLALDLDGFNTDSNGLFVLGNVGVNGVSITFPDNTLQNGADAVALYNANATDFPNGTAVTASNIVDAVVYDTNDADATVLLNILTPGQVQLNEAANGIEVVFQSNSRVPDGGTALNTGNFVQQTATPGTFNLPRISIDDVSQNEGNAGATSYSFTVTHNGTIVGDISVDFATADGTATLANNDYSVSSGTVSFSSDIPTIKTQTVTVTINGDLAVEADETFFINLSNLSSSAATIFDAQGMGAIVNDDVANISINDVSMNEGDVGITNLDFTISIDSTANASVQVDTSDVSAFSASDYTAIVAQTVTFTSGGSTTQTLSVPIIGDVTIEADETFNVNLSNAVGANISDNLGVGTILKDDTVQAILSANKSVSGDTIAGGAITYTVEIQNTGPNIQNDNPGDEMVDALPAFVSFVSATASSGVVSNVGNMVAWNGSIPASGSVTINIDAIVAEDAKGSISNQALLFYDNDGNSTNESNAQSNVVTFVIPYIVPLLNNYGMLMLFLLLGLIALKHRKLSHE